MWIKTTDKKPENMQKIYVLIKSPKYPKGYKYIHSIAIYISYMTVKEEDFMHEDYYGYGDYNKLDDTIYVSAGFYEFSIESDMNYKISSNITHWMPLIQKPVL
jgi:hypothetical protein